MAAEVHRGTLVEGAVIHAYRELIVCNPAVMMGNPVVSGTRITVELILEKMAAGETGSGF